MDKKPLSRGLDGLGGMALAHVAFVALALYATGVSAAERWYEPSAAAKGRSLYATQCAACHGEQGEGQPNWQQRDSMGFYPAPPLNADGHAWHHSLTHMLQVLATGGGPTGGTMPSFADVLKERDQRAVLAYVQSLWPDEIYAQWVEIDAGRAEPPAMPDTMKEQHHH